MTNKSPDQTSAEPQSGPLIDKALPVAVPMWMLEHKDKPIDWMQKRASICSQKIAEKGDVLMYGSKTKGAAGDVFNHLAEGMALLLLITENPVPFGKIVFMPDGDFKVFDSDKDANDFVWPKERVL